MEQKGLREVADEVYIHLKDKIRADVKDIILDHLGVDKKTHITHHMKQELSDEDRKLVRNTGLKTVTTNLVTGLINLVVIVAVVLWSR